MDPVPMGARHMVLPLRARTANSRVKSIVPLLALLVFAAPGPARGQVFIASQPGPDFGIGPLFVSVSVRPADVDAARAPMPVSVLWSLVLPPHRKAADIAQDLYLLWPGELAGTPGAAGADPALVRRVGEAGFRVKESGRLPLSARSRTDMGTSAGFVALGEAPFVTFAREGGHAEARGAGFVRIPWKPEMASLDWLVRLELPLRDVIVRRRVGWGEETFWGRRYTLSLGFGDVGNASLYPLYFGARDRVVPLARDFSMLVVNFAAAEHLKVEEVVPATVTRGMSETRADTETFRLPLVASEGLVPQQLKVRFSYFSGRLPWRPILISALLLGLGNLTGPLFLALARRVGRTLRQRIHLGRPADGGRQSGTILPREALEKVRPGETTYADVLRLLGPHAEEQERLPDGATRTLVYRGRRVVPNRRRSFYWFSTVSHWNVEDHEVQIDFERDRVRDVQARVRRSRPAVPGEGVSS
jgi:hypothetical protein